MTTNKPIPAASSDITAKPARPAKAGRRARLAPSQKYEIFTSVLTSSATQRELAEKYGIDRTTIRSICATAMSRDPRSASRFPAVSIFGVTSLISAALSCRST